MATTLHCKHASYFIKSLYSIQKTPSLLPWAISSWRRCCGQSVHSSDQLPFHEKRPHGLRSRSNLKPKDVTVSEEADGQRGRAKSRIPVKSDNGFQSTQSLLLLWVIAYFLTTHFILLPPPYSEKLRRHNGKNILESPLFPKKKVQVNRCFSSPPAPSRTTPTRFRSRAVAHSSTHIALWQ